MIFCIFETKVLKLKDQNRIIFSFQKYKDIGTRRPKQTCYLFLFLSYHSYRNPGMHKAWHRKHQVRKNVSWTLFFIMLQTFLSAINNKKKNCFPSLPSNNSVQWSVIRKSSSKNDWISIFPKLFAFQARSLAGSYSSLPRAGNMSWYTSSCLCYWLIM